MTAPSTSFPSGLAYSPEHTWLDSAAATGGRVGITQTAADRLSDIVYLELPKVGSAVSAGEVVGEVESSKSVSDLYSPVTGTVVAVNEEAIAEPSIVNDDPFGRGWLFDVAEAVPGDLLSAADYEAAVGEDA
jgi:glycine cleavage system H protein